MAKSTETKTLLMELSGGRKRRVTVPASCKVTFGPLVPSERMHKGEHALRIYESRDRQLAVFTDVVAFREEGIKIEELVKKTERKSMGKDSPNAAAETIVEVSVTEWRDPDNPGQYEKADKAFSQLADLRKTSDDE